MSLILVYASVASLTTGVPHFRPQSHRRMRLEEADPASLYSQRQRPPKVHRGFPTRGVSPVRAASPVVMRGVINVITKMLTYYAVALGTVRALRKVWREVHTCDKY